MKAEKFDSSIIVFDEPNMIDLSFSVNEESNRQNADEQKDNAFNNLWAKHQDKSKEWFLHKKISESTKEINSMF